MPQFIELEKLAVGGLTDLSVDRGQDTRASLSVRSTARRPGPFQRAELSGRSTGTVDRPSCQNWRARLCTWAVDRLKPGSTVKGI